MTTLIPIIVALALSLLARNVILGLFSGVFIGVMMLNGPQPLEAFGIMVK